MKSLLLFAAAFGFTLAPLQAKTTDADSADGTEQVSKKSKKAGKAAKKLADQKKARAKLKFKWCKSLKAGLATAKKYNTTCLVVFSNPQGCAYCVKLDAEVFQNKKFKNAKGIGVGYTSTQPIEEYGLIEGMPSVVIVGPDGKPIGGQLGYIPDSDNLAYYLKQLEEAQPAWDESGEEDAEDAPSAPEIP